MNKLFNIIILLSAKKLNKGNIIFFFQFYHLCLANFKNYDKVGCLL